MMHRVFKTSSHRLLRYLFIAATCGFSGFIGHAGVAQPVYLEPVTASALRKVTANLSVEADMSADQIAKLIAAEHWAKAAVEKVYGSVTSNPVIYAFTSEATYRRFGGGVTLARFDGDYIVVSPRGLKGHFIAHEWSHAEMQQRLTPAGYWRLPAWFDEGIATVIGQAPETADPHWQWLLAHQIPYPSRVELLSFNTPLEWEDAVHRYGEDLNMQRLLAGEPQQRPVYTAARRELQRWLAKAGTKGLLQIIATINAHRDFMAAYQQYLPRL